VDQLDNIINGCLKGDRKCQEQLYKMFSKRMFGLCLQYADNQDDAADILQEGFIKVFRKLEQFGGNAGTLSQSGSVISVNRKYGEKR
jgi:RNA polymerase sigma-70 factor (ECF subfamily)